MGKLGIVISAIIIVILSVFYRQKIAPNIPVPSEGILYYYKCSDFPERRLLPKNAQTRQDILSSLAPLYVLIPGYTESTIRDWLQVVMTGVTEAHPSSCVLFVEHWNYLTLSRPYMTINVKRIAEDIANVLLSLQWQSHSNVHVIGFSLGGWVAGCISNYLPKDKQIGRITGLDPSFPWADTTNPDDYLDTTDAEVVVVLRTSRISQRVPTVKFDFCVNGCMLQPECDVWYHLDFMQQICSHSKAPFLFAFILTEKETDFSCCQCPDRSSLLQGHCPCLVKNSFGLNTLLNIPGTFFMENSTEIKRSL